MLLLKFCFIGFLLFIPAYVFRGIHKVSVIVFAYPLWILAGLAIGMPATRILILGEPFYGQYIWEAFYIALLSYAIFLLVLFPYRREYVEVYLPLGNPIRAMLLILFYLNAILAYPHAMGFGGGRFGSFGSGCVVWFALIFCSRKSDKDFILILAWLLCAWLFSRGERVDFVLALILPFFVSVTSFRKIGWGKLAFFFVLFFVGLYAGLARNGLSISFSDLVALALLSITSFGTAVDVVHVYLSSIWFANEREASILPLLNLLASYIPGFPGGGASNPHNFSILIKEEIDNVGGGLFYSMLAPVLGWVGVVLLSFLYAFFYRSLLRSGLIFGVLFYAFWIMQFRLQWYGLTYFSNVFWLLLFFSLLILFFLKKGLVCRIDKEGA